MNTGYIYKLSAPDCPFVYIGSTKNVDRRFKQHKTYPTKGSKVVMGYSGSKIDVLETLNYDDKIELKKKERHHILQNISNISNIQHPTRTHKEYYQDNIEKIKDHQNSIEICNDCGKTYTKRNKARHYKKYCTKQNDIELKMKKFFLMMLMIFNV
jgi:predicted GIY-YIG superfamily endonuclease